MTQAANIDRIAAGLDAFLKEQKPERLLLHQSPGDEGLNLAVLGHPRVLKVLQDHGFYNVAMDVRHEFQPLAEKVKAPGVTPADMAQEAVEIYRRAGDEQAGAAYANMHSRGTFIEKTQELGFSVHFLNDRGTLKEYTDMLDRTAGAQDRIGETLRGQQGKIASILNRQFTDAAPSRDTAIAAKTHIEQSLARQTDAQKELSGIHDQYRESDEAMAERIKEIEAQNGQKTVILAAEVRGSSGIVDDLDEYLGRTATIRLSASRDELTMASQADLVHGRQRPDLYLDVSTGDAVTAKEAVESSKDVARQLSEKPGLKI